MKKLNAKGFSHWILPLAAVVVIAGVGTYVITKSKAASTRVFTSSSVDVYACRNSRGYIDAAVRNKTSSVIGAVYLSQYSQDQLIWWGYLSPFATSSRKPVISGSYTIDKSTGTNTSPTVRLGSFRIPSSTSLPRC